MNNPLMPPSWMIKIVEERGIGTLQTHTRHFGNYCAFFPFRLRGDIRKNEKDWVACGNPLINMERKNPFFDPLDHCHFIAAAITVTVSFRVLNKTSEEYWFLTKFNFSDVHVEGNMEIGGITSLTEYFLVRLLTHSRLKFATDTFNA